MWIEVKRTFRLLFVFWSLTSLTTKISYAGNDNYPLGARSAGIANASVTMTDIWASANNQAGLCYLERATAAIFYENRLNVNKLALHAGAFAIPVYSTVIGVNYRYFGYSKYNDTKIGLAVSKRLGEKFAVGVQMNYFHTHFADDYGNSGVLCAEIGILYEPVEKLFVGAHLFNVSQSKQKVNYNERIPTIMRFGVSYKIHEKTMVSLETEKDLRMDAIFKGGFEYSPISDLTLRCGVSNGCMYQYAFGLGYGWNRFVIDISFCHHKFLGYTPHISLIFR